MTLPPGDSDFSRRWWRTKGAFTRSAVAAGLPLSRDYRGEYALWQKRSCEHAIRNDADFERCADYIHFNPVEHQLVSSPAAWPFSSLHRYIPLALDWRGSSVVGDSADF